jgi:hypothetical protein
MTHFPRETPGCYHHTTTMCWLCMARMVWAVIMARRAR